MAQRKDGEEHDNVKRPAHYTREGAMECIDEMMLVFEPATVKDFCLLNGNIAQRVGGFRNEAASLYAEAAFLLRA